MKQNANQVETSVNSPRGTMTPKKTVRKAENERQRLRIAAIAIAIDAAEPH